MVLVIVGGWTSVQPGSKLFKINGVAQGTTYSMQYFHTDSIISKSSIDSIFHAIDLSLSLYNNRSLISRFNRDGRVKMDGHMKKVVEHSIAIWKSSNGCFDITVKNLVDLWGFGGNSTGKVPASTSVSENLQVTGSHWLNIKDDSLVALRKNVRIDCNGIAQGYSVDVIVDFLLSKGLKGVMVELGGEVRTMGGKNNGEMWRIGLESPSGIAENWYPVERVIGLKNLSVTTSGNYRKYFLNRGNKYGHVIDPRSGYPVDNGIISVTVVAPEAITADGWDNGFYVMGIDSSFALVKKYPGLELNIIYHDREGNIRDTSSAGFKKILLH